MTVGEVMGGRWTGRVVEYRTGRKQEFFHNPKNKKKEEEMNRKGGVR